MNRHHPPPTPDDPLLQRYREANALDTARPGPALRENVLAHARSAAASRAENAAPQTRAAANDSVWSWKAFGSLAVIGLVGLLLLQFDRGTPDEKEAALGTGVTRPNVQPAPAPAATAPAAESALPSTAPTAPQPAVVAPPSGRVPVFPQQAPDLRPDAAQRSRPASAAPPVAIGQADEAERPAEAAAVAPAASADTALHPEPPALAAAPAPAAKAAAARAPMPMAPTAPAATPPAPAPALAEAQGAAPAPASRNATEGLSRERREVTTAGPAAATAPLFAAIAAGDLNAVRQGLREGADPNQRGAGGQTPLMAAARRGNEAIVRLLLAAGADRALRDPQGLSAADYAERAGHSALLPLLQ